MQRDRWIEVARPDRGRGNQYLPPQLACSGGTWDFTLQIQSHIRRRAIFFVAQLLLGIVLAQTALADSPAKAVSSPLNIKGQVRNERKEPVKGAKVWLKGTCLSWETEFSESRESDVVATTVTDGEGHFAFRDVTVGKGFERNDEGEPELVVVVQAPGLAVTWKDCTKSADLGSLTLRPGATIRGRFVTKGKLPYKGFYVRVVEIQPVLNDSTATGNASKSAVASCPLSKNGPAAPIPVTSETDPPPPKPPRASHEPTSPAPQKLVGGGNVEPLPDSVEAHVNGTHKELKSVLNLANSRIFLQAVTDQEGRFVLDSLPSNCTCGLMLHVARHAGPCVLAATTARRQSEYIIHTSDSSIPDLWTVPVHTQSFTQELGRLRTLRGRITFADTQQPYAKGQILLTSGQGPGFYAAVTDERGEFVIDRLHDSSFGLRVAGSPELGYPPAKFLVPGNDFDEHVNLELLRVANIRGIVVDEQTSKGVPGVHVEFLPLTATRYRVFEAVSDAHGRFSIPALGCNGSVLFYGWLPPYRLAESSEAFSRTGYSAIDMRFNHGFPEVRIEVNRGRTIRGQVTDPAGRPLAGACVIEYPGAGDWDYHVETTTDATGNYELRGASLRTHRFLQVSHAARGLKTLAAIPAVQRGSKQRDVRLNVQTQPVATAVVKIRGNGKPLSEPHLGIEELTPDEKTGQLRFLPLPNECFPANGKGPPKQRDLPMAVKWTISTDGVMSLQNLVAGRKYRLDVDSLSDSENLERSSKAFVPRPGEVRDLGIINLQEPWELEIVVRDRSGKPVPDLSIQPTLDLPLAVSPADEDAELRQNAIEELKTTSAVTGAQGIAKLQHLPRLNLILNLKRLAPADPGAPPDPTSPAGYAHYFANSVKVSAGQKSATMIVRRRDNPQ